MIMFLLAALGGLAAWKGLAASPTGVAIPPVGIDTGQSLRSRPGSGDALSGRGGSVTPSSGATPSDSILGIATPTTEWYKTQPLGGRSAYAVFGSIAPPAGYKTMQGIQPEMGLGKFSSPVHPMMPAIPAPLISPARPVSPGSI